MDGKLDDPAVTVEFPSQIVLDYSAPSSREFLLDRLSPPDDRHSVGVIVCLKQPETLAVVEFAVKIDGLDFSVKAVENTKKRCKDAAGSIAVFETAHCQRACSSRARIGVEGSRSTFCFRVIEAVRLVFVTIVGSQVEVVADLRLLRQNAENVLLKQRIAGLLNRF